MTTDNMELKPCPLPCCKGTATIINSWESEKIFERNIMQWYWRIHCQKCGLALKYRYQTGESYKENTRQQILNDWNTRPSAKGEEWIIAAKNEIYALNCQLTDTPPARWAYRIDADQIESILRKHAPDVSELQLKAADRDQWQEVAQIVASERDDLLNRITRLEEALREIKNRAECELENLNNPTPRHETFGVLKEIAAEANITLSASPEHEQGNGGEKPLPYKWTHVENKDGHEWGIFRDDPWNSCHKCGMVRRADDKNGPCKGKPEITLRGHTGDAG